MPKSTSHVENGPLFDLRWSGKEFLRQIANSPVKLFHLLLVWQQRTSDRNRLTTMPNYLLRDMGLSPSDVNGETAKPFWKA